MIALAVTSARAITIAYAITTAYASANLMRPLVSVNYAGYGIGDIVDIV